MTCMSLNFEAVMEISFFRIKAFDGFPVHVIAGNPGGHM